LRIVVTGAPASGKTELIERLKTHPAFADFLFFDELARRLLQENPGYRTNRDEFHREIYRRQIARELQAGDKPFITDRGTIDAFAFHPESAEQVGTTIPKEYQRYSAVIQLGTSAALGEECYRQDAVRKESASDAMIIEQAIVKVWQDHPCYHFVPSEKDYEKKYAHFLSLLLKLMKVDK